MYKNRTVIRTGELLLQDLDPVSQPGDVVRLALVQLADLIRLPAIPLPQLVKHIQMPATDVEGAVDRVYVQAMPFVQPVDIFRQPAIALVQPVNLCCVSAIELHHLLRDTAKCLAGWLALGDDLRAGSCLVVAGGVLLAGCVLVVDRPGGGCRMDVYDVVHVS